MGFVTNSDGRAYEEIKWHSRQKHAFLEAYLSIWSEQTLELLQEHRST